jgi:hypothetical protein
MAAGNSGGGADQPRPHLSTHEVAQRYGVHANTVLGWLKRVPGFPRPFRGAAGKYRAS